MNTPLKRCVVDNTLDRNKEPLPSVWPERQAVAG
jgi:hypothetical protein